MTLQDIYQKAIGVAQQKFFDKGFEKQQRLPLPTLPEGYRGKNTIQPTPTPTPEPKQYRNPIYENQIYKSNQNPVVKFDEMLAGAQEASQRWEVPLDLLMDIPAIESSGGQFGNQMSGGPAVGPYAFEMPLKDDIQAIVNKIFPDSEFNPLSATDSANLAGYLIKNKQLQRWGKPDGTWGSLNNPNNTNGKLTDYYSPEELNPYLGENFQFPI